MSSSSSSICRPANFHFPASSRGNYTSVFVRLPVGTKERSFATQFVKNKARPDLGRVQSRRMLGLITAASGQAAVSAEGKPELLIFETEEELSDSLAEYAAELSKKFARERGAFSVVVSGGSLIKSLRKLAASSYVESIDWSKWHVFWVDERVVPKDHSDSNYKLANDQFLSKVPIPPGQIYAINDTLSAEGAADDYEARLKQLVQRDILVMGSTGFPKFDLMLLGMGPDGHVASLFPGHPLVEENSRWVAFIKESPKPPPERITFTFPVINSSSNIALVATGAGKAGPVGGAFGAGSTTDRLPIQMISPVDGKLAWFADKAAASML